MAKTFRLRISRVIKSSFHSCRSKHPSTFPKDPVPSFFPLPPVNPNLITLDFPTTHPPPPPSSSTKHHQTHLTSFKRHVSSALISLGCGCGSKSAHRTKPQQFQWQKEEEEWHIVAKVCGHSDSSPRQKIYGSSISGDSDQDILAPPSPPPQTVEKKKKRRGKKKKTTGKHRTSTSSADSGLFSSEERQREETETLVSSSRSSSTEFNPQLETIREKPNKRRNKKKKAAAKRGVSKGMLRISVSSATECDSPARLSALKKLIPWAVEGKVKESLAVMKKSEDPYEDFMRSMMDMICEKQMFEERELEQLLQCFLSLNSRQHHGAIVEAFSEIWNALFSPTTSS